MLLQGEWYACRRRPLASLATSSPSSLRAAVDSLHFKTLLHQLRALRGKMPSQDSTAAQLERVRALCRSHDIQTRKRAIQIANAAGEYDAADELAFDTVRWK